MFSIRTNVCSKTNRFNVLKRIGWFLCDVIKIPIRKLMATGLLLQHFLNIRERNFAGKFQGDVLLCFQSQHYDLTKFVAVQSTRISYRNVIKLA